MAAAVASARYMAHDAPLAPAPTNTEKVPADQIYNPPPADMRQQMNPTALPFQPDSNRNRPGNQLPQVTPQGESSAQRAYDNYVAQQQHQAAYQTWPQYYGYQGYPSDFYSAAPPYSQPYGHFYPGPPPSLHYEQQLQRNYPSHTFSGPATSSLSALPYRAKDEELQYAFDTLIKNLKPKKRKSNTPRRPLPLLPRPLKSEPEAAPDSHVKQKEKPKTSKPQPQASQKKGRYGDQKIMLPAPLPTVEYLQQAAEEPSFSTAKPGHILVILDLNGTLLYRPNRNPKTMIERPFLEPFLRFLFDNFSVMVWSSAKPDNVKSLVSQSLDKKLQSKLVARWARESFGLSPANYNQNVQVYKNLKLVWSRDVIQQHHPEYATGQRFGQHNTVLIDDSVIKASAQPHNLLEIPEFSATAEQMEGNVLQEVVGYLEQLKLQGDVSKFIRKEPFKVGQWSHQFPKELDVIDGFKDLVLNEKSETVNTV